MYLFTKKFWGYFLHDPKEAIDTLVINKSHLGIHIFKTIVFLRITISEYLGNQCFTRASALAYALLLTLIPLVVSLAFMLTSLSEINSYQIERLFKFFLPFAPQTILSYLISFFENAQKLKGIGIGVLILMTVGLFGTVENSLNTIWKVARSRSFFIRLRTFTMVTVYSPILFIASFQIRRSFQLNFPDLPFITSIIPFSLSVLGFTSLIFFVPNTKVKVSSAFAGGIIAGILYDMERRWFSTYIEFSSQTQTIYGTFGVLTFFLASLFLVSIIILLGAQIAYVHQNFRPLLRAKKRWDRRVGDYRTYITFRILLDCVMSFIKKQKPPTLTVLSQKYELTEAQASGLLKWLIHEGYLHNIANKDAFVPSRDFSNISVIEVIDAIEDQNRKIPSTPHDYTRTLIQQLFKNSKDQLVLLKDNLTFGEMISRIEAESSKTISLTNESIMIA